MALIFRIAKTWHKLARMTLILRDPRIRIIEISEYASLRDLDRVYVSKLVDVFSAALKR